MNASDKKGRAFESAVLNELGKVLKIIGSVTYDQGVATRNAQAKFDELTAAEQENYSYLALRGATVIADDIHARIGEIENPVLVIQSDSRGISGDVRDILIQDEVGEVKAGISVKHNHNAVKHLRLSPRIDFGSNWLGTPCSQEYWNEINEVFDELAQYGNKVILWENTEIDKVKDVYTPLLDAFSKEFQRIVKLQQDNAVRNLFIYLFGEFAYYKLIGKGTDKSSQTKVLFFDFSREHKHLIPRKIESIYRERDNKLVIEFEKGWVLSFRIHNASSKIERSMKFDIQPVKMPAEIVMYEE